MISAEDARAEAERASSAKSMFLAAASHDLRQPAQSLTLLLATLKQQSHTPQALKAMGMMEAAMNGLNSLLSSILDISKLDAGLVMATMTECNVSDLIQRLCIEYMPWCEKKGLDLRSHCRPNLFARTDSALIERVARNLMENAIKFTDNGGILVSTQMIGDRLHIEISDTGIGIPTDKIANIFDEFYQVANLNRDRRQGLGLGLSIVKRLADLMGAEIHVRSREGSGSQFSLSLKLDQPHPRHTASLDLNPVENNDTLDACILVIEDDESVRTTLQMILESWGCEVLTAESSEAALTLARLYGERLHAIIADHRLGEGRTGAETVDEIRVLSKGRGFPTIILTGDTAPDRIEQIRVSGYEMMHKPVKAEDLKRLLIKLLKIEKI